MSTYAQPQDVVDRWDGAPLDPGRVQVLLDDAENLLPADVDARITAGWTTAAKVTQVLCNMVIRVLRNPAGARTDTTGPYTTSWDPAVSSGKLWLTGSDRKLLGLRRKASSLQLVDDALPLIGSGRPGSWDCD